MKINEVDRVDDTLSELVARFRVDLDSYRGIVSEMNVEAGRQEVEEYLSAGFPIYIASIDDMPAGYLVCRVDRETVWVESLFVQPEYRRRGIAGALHRKAEEVAAARGGDTLYHYVHPNNHGMIRFLCARGYSVLNLIEIRKPYPDEAPMLRIRVGEHEFDY